MDIPVPLMQMEDLVHPFARNHHLPAVVAFRFHIHSPLVIKDIIKAIVKNGVRRVHSVPPLALRITASA